MIYQYLTYKIAPGFEQLHQMRSPVEWTYMYIEHGIRKLLLNYICYIVNITCNQQ